MTKKAEVLEIKRARGTKRTCQNAECRARFYDLDRTPIICPVCASPFVIPSTPVPLAAEPRRPKRVEYPVVEDAPAETAPPDTEAALAEAEREEQIETEEDEPVLDVEEEERADVSDIIDEPLEGDKES